MIWFIWCGMVIMIIWNSPWRKYLSEHYTRVQRHNENSFHMVRLALTRIHNLVSDTSVLHCDQAYISAYRYPILPNSLGYQGLVVNSQILVVKIPPSTIRHICFQFVLFFQWNFLAIVQMHLQFCFRMIFLLFELLQYPRMSSLAEFRLTKIKGYIDVGDGCWRTNVLVTRFGCWWPISNVTNILFCHHYLKMVTIVKSPT